MPKRKKAEVVDDVSDSTEKPIISPDKIDLHELVTRLKEFENKVLLERLKVIERSLSLIYAKQLQTYKQVEELTARVEALYVSHDELMNTLGVSEYSPSPSDHEDSNENSSDKDEKKWN
jgi:hypothetical protein